MRQREDEEQIAEALIGEEAKKFVESDLGRAVLGMAEQEVRDAQEKLLDVVPTDVQAIERLQAQARLGTSFRKWLEELITNGEHALVAWRQKEHGQER